MRSIYSLERRRKSMDRENYLQRLRRQFTRPESKCPVCGAEFQSLKRSDVKYCSNACKQKYFRNNKEGKK
jgi:hypothetical protein